MEGQKDPDCSWGERALCNLSFFQNALTLDLPSKVLDVKKYKDNFALINYENE